MSNKSNLELNQRDFIKKCPKCVITDEYKVIVYPHFILNLNTLFFMGLAIKLMGILFVIFLGTELLNISEEYRVIGLLFGSAIYLFGIQVSGIYRVAKKEIATIKQDRESARSRDIKAKLANMGKESFSEYKRETSQGKVLWTVENGYVYIFGKRKYNIALLKILSLILSFLCAAALILSIMVFLAVKQGISLIIAFLLAITFFVALYYKKIADLSNAIVMTDYKFRIDKKRYEEMLKEKSLKIERE